LQGETDPERLADLARGNARKKRSELIQALHGRVSAHHRRLLKLHLGLIDSLQQALATVDADVGKTLAPIEECARLLTTMLGVSELTAHVLVAEIGVDMARFPTAGHLLSWATMCPRNDESAGKRRSTRTRKGAPWLKTALVTAAWAAVRVKGTCRPSSCASKLVVAPKKPFSRSPPRCSNAAWHMLKDRVEYKDLGADHFVRRDRSKAIQRLLRRLNDLGCKVAVP